jgi:hypothetical protein
MRWAGPCQIQPAATQRASPGADQLPPLDGRPPAWPCQGRMHVCTSPLIHVCTSRLIMGRCQVKYRAFIGSASGLALARPGRLRRERTRIADRVSSSIRHARNDPR